MELRALSCGHCGAAIEVPDATNYVTCVHCGSRLEIVRTASAVYTEVIEQIQANTGRMADQLETIRLQNELERIDREWQLERESYVSRNSDGATSVPDGFSGAGALIGSGIAVVFGLFWVSQATSMGAPAGMVLFGYVFILLALVGGVAAAVQASNYQKTEAAYQERRSKVLEELEGRR